MTKIFLINYLNMVVLESNKVIVRSDKAFFSQREANNCSEI